MKIQVSGKKVEIGEALKERIVTDLTQGIIKYFERGGDAEVTLSKQGHLFKIDCWVKLASGQTLLTQGSGGDAHAAFDSALEHMEKRIRRYKRRLKNHKAALQGQSRQELMPMMVIQSVDEDIDDDFDDHDSVDGANLPQSLIIAETEATLRTLTVSQAVVEMDMSGYPVLVFRNAAHDGLSVVYRRPDGNIGWIDPERTRKKSAA